MLHLLLLAWLDRAAPSHAFPVRRAPHARLVFVRHGQSEWNREGRFTGWVDVDLTQLGREQAADGAEELLRRGITFDSAFTSELRRAQAGTLLRQPTVSLDAGPAPAAHRSPHAPPSRRRYRSSFRRLGRRTCP